MTQVRGVKAVLDRVSRHQATIIRRRANTTGVPANCDGLPPSNGYQSTASFGSYLSNDGVI